MPHSSKVLKETTTSPKESRQVQFKEDTPAVDVPRLQREEQERKQIYETAESNYRTVLNEARQNNLAAYHTAKEVINRCQGDVDRAAAVCKEYQDRLDAAKAKLEEARNELEAVKKAFDLNTEGAKVWQAERSFSALKKDELAKLQMVQAHVDWREAEVALRSQEFAEKDKEKSKLETPYEMAHAELWKAGEELKRLGISPESIENGEHKPKEEAVPNNEAQP